MMKKHLVFVGGGHAHLTALLRMREYVDRGHRVTVVSPSSYQYYSGMGPGMLSGIYRPQDIRFHIKRMTEDRGGTFIEDSVVRIDPEHKTLLLQAGGPLDYDIVSFNTGSGVSDFSSKGTDANIFAVKPIINLLKAKNAVLEGMPVRAMRIAVVGGGPAGVEIAGNVWRLVRDHRGDAEITLIAGRMLLKAFPERVRSMVMSSFRDRGISFVEGKRVNAVGNKRVTFDDGSSQEFDIAFIATGVIPSPLFRESGLPVGPDGGLLVNSSLQSVRYPEIFGGGDCINLEGHQLAKVGVYAVRENMILYQNLMASLEGGSFTAFSPQKHYMLIFNLGNGKGVLWRGRFVWQGRTAFLLKDYIDRKFMRTFQVSGEQNSNDK